LNNQLGILFILFTLFGFFSVTADRATTPDVRYRLPWSLPV